MGEVENKQLSKVDGQDELDEVREEVEWIDEDKDKVKGMRGPRNVTEIEYQTKATRGRSRWVNITAAKIWRKESITKMKRKKVRNKGSDSERERREPEPSSTIYIL